MKNKTIMIVLVVFSVLVVGAIGFILIKGEEQRDLLNHTIESLEKDIFLNKTALEVNNIMNEWRDDSLEMLSLSNKYRNLSKSAFLDFSEPGYSTIQCESCVFLVKIDRVEKYMDGYNVFLNIGNISAIDYVGITIYAIWGTSASSLEEKYYDESEDDVIEYSTTKTFKSAAPKDSMILFL